MILIGELHCLLDILFLALCAVIAGMDDWETIEERGNANLDWLRQVRAAGNRQSVA